MRVKELIENEEGTREGHSLKNAERYIGMLATLFVFSFIFLE